MPYSLDTGIHSSLQRWSRSSGGSTVNSYCYAESRDLLANVASHYIIVTYNLGCCCLFGIYFKLGDTLLRRYPSSFAKLLLGGDSPLSGAIAATTYFANKYITNLGGICYLEYQTASTQLQS